MSTMSKDQVVAFVRGITEPERERLLVSMIMETMEKASFLDRYFSGSSEALRFRLSLTGNGVAIVQEADSQEVAKVSIGGSNGAWLKYVLLNTLEGQPPPGLAASFFTSSPSPLQRVNRMNNEIYRAISMVFPCINFRVRATSVAAKHRLPERDVLVSSYETSWSKEVHMTGPALEAQSCYINASTEWTQGHMDTALSQIASAIDACALFFPSYSLLLKSHGSRQEVVTAFCSRPDIRPGLLAGALAMEQWLRDVRKGFNPEAVSEYADVVQRICVQDIDVRLSKVARVIALLAGDAPSALDETLRNPLNPLLTFFRQPDQTHYSAEDIVEGQDFKDLLRDTLEAVKADSRYSSVASEFRDADLLSALVRLAEENTTVWFPEPTGKASWRDDTVRIWKDAVFAMLLAPASNPWQISIDATPQVLNHAVSSPTIQDQDHREGDE